MRNRGFTLIEIIIALFVFTILAAIASFSLHTIIIAHERTSKSAQHWQQLQIALTLMQRDIAQSINRPVLDKTGAQHAAMVGDNSKGYLEFTHNGLNNPFAIEKRSTMQRVAYYVKDGKLYRLTWQVLDRAPTSKPTSKVLLTGITAWKMAFLDDTNVWRNYWPMADDIPLPKAVEITLNIKPWGNIIRIFKIN